MATRHFADQAASKTSDSYCSSPKELVTLCTEYCPHEDCTSRDGCKEYKAIAKAIKQGEAFEWPKPWWETASEGVTDPQALLDIAWKKQNAPPMSDDFIPFPAISIEPDNPTPEEQANQRTALRQLNKAIEALDAVQHSLWEETIIQDMLRDLAAMRCKHFECLVDWDAVAGGKS